MEKDRHLSRISPSGSAMSHSRMTDRALAQRTRDGDERAFAVLVRRHRDTLVRFVARRGRPDLAEDAVQEALASAHAALRDGRVPSDVTAWLHTIAWRRALDLLRRERDALPLEGDLLAGGEAEPHDVIARRDDLARTLDAWGALPERQRAALVLSVLEGRTLTEIADALDVNASAAKALVARGRRTLAGRIEDAGLDCEEIRPAVLQAVGRGVRLSGVATRHVRDCPECAALHRELRAPRRRMAAIFSVPALLAARFELRFAALRERLRDVVLLPGAEPQVGSVAKLCALACAGALTSTPAAMVAEAPVPHGSAVRAKVARAAPRQQPAAPTAAPVSTRAPAASPAVAAQPVAATSAPKAQPARTTTSAATPRPAREIVAPVRRPLPANEVRRAVAVMEANGRTPTPVVVSEPATESGGTGSLTRPPATTVPADTGVTTVPSG